MNQTYILGKQKEELLQQDNDESRETLQKYHRTDAGNSIENKLKMHELFIEL